MTPTARLLQFLGRCTCPIDQQTARLASNTTDAEFAEARQILADRGLIYGGRIQRTIEITHAGQTIVDRAWSFHLANGKLIGDPLTELDELIERFSVRGAA